MSLEQRPPSRPTANGPPESSLPWGRGTYADRLQAAGQEIARLTRRAEQAERELAEARAEATVTAGVLRSALSENESLERQRDEACRWAKVWKWKAKSLRAVAGSEADRAEVALDLEAQSHRELAEARGEVERLSGLVDRFRRVHAGVVEGSGVTVEEAKELGDDWREVALARLFVGTMNCAYLAQPKGGESGQAE